MVTLHIPQEHFLSLIHISMCIRDRVEKCRCSANGADWSLSIHSPALVETWRSAAFSAPLSHFQSTHPRWLRPHRLHNWAKPTTFNPLTLAGWDCKLRLFFQRYYQSSAFSLELSLIHSHHTTVMIIPVRNFGAKDPRISCSLAFRTQLYTSSLVKLLPSAVQSEWFAVKQWLYINHCCPIS